MNASLPCYLRDTAQGLILEVVVVPRAKQSRFVGFHGGYPKIALAAPPIEGRANEELLSFMRRLLGIPTRSIEIVRGDAGRRKGLLLRGASPDQVLQALKPSEGLEK